jgi:hypothetical protein
MGRLWAIVATLWLGCGQEGERTTGQRPRSADAAAPPAPATPPPAAAPAAEPAQPTPPPTPMGDPMRFVETRRGRPGAGEGCPDADACVSDFDFATFVSARRWRSHYVIDHGRPGIPIAEGDPSRDELWRRVEAAVRAVLARERATRAKVHCSLAGLMPGLVGASEVYAATVPAGDETAEPPAPVTPSEANAVSDRAHAAIGYPDARQRRFFNPEEQARMTGDTFERPQVGVRGAFMGTDQSLRVAHLAAIWSPESRRVYVLDASKSYPSDANPFRALDREVEERVVQTLRGLQITRVGVETYALCRFPRLTGTGEWLDAALATSPP